MGCCSTLARDLLRLVAFATALGGGLMLLLALPYLLPYAHLPLEWQQAYFPALQAVLGALLLVTGALASCSLWCCHRSWTAPLHLLTGATLALLPLEAVALGAWKAQEPLIRRWAEEEPTHALADLLAWVDAHSGVAGCLAAAWLALQVLGVSLASLQACCGRTQRAKRPWERVWEEEPAGGAHAPLLPRSWDGQAESSGYRTPPSRLGTPEASPQRLPPSHAASPY